MRLTVYRFKCYAGSVPTVFEFQPGNMTLINGESGVGKSTIFDAILWCLYGGMQHIYPTGTQGSAKEQTYVIIELPEFAGLVIRRMRPPDTIDVVAKFTASTVGAKEEMKCLSNSEAQAYIVSIFGYKEFFIMSSYIQQKTHSLLITGTNAEKNQLLSELTFGGQQVTDDENPDTYIDRIDAEIAVIKQAVLMETSKYNTIHQLYISEYKTHEAECSLWSQSKFSQSPAEFTPHIQQTTSALSQIDSEISKALIQETQLKELQTQLAILEKSIVPPTELDPKIDIQIATLKRRIYSSKDIDTKRAEFSMLRAKGLDRYIASDFEVESDELENLRTKYYQILRNQSDASSFNIECTVDAISVAISQMTVTIAENITLKEEHDKWFEEHTKVFAEYTKNVEQRQNEYATLTAKLTAEYQKEFSEYKQESSRRQQILTQHKTFTDLYETYKHEKQLYQQRLEQIEDMKQQLVTITTRLSNHENTIAEKYAEFNAKYLSGSSMTLESLRKIRERLLQLKNQLQCPTCKHPIIYDNGVLKAGLVAPDTDDVLQILIDYERDLLTTQAFKQTIEKLNEQISKPPVDPIQRNPPPKLEAFEKLIEPVFNLPPYIQLQKPTVKAEPQKPSNVADLKLKVEQLTKLKTSVETLTDDIGKLKRRIEFISNIPTLKIAFDRYVQVKEYLDTHNNSGNVQIMISELNELEKRVKEYTEQQTKFDLFTKQRDELNERLKSVGMATPAVSSSKLQEKKVGLVTYLQELKRLEAAQAIYLRLQKRHTEVSQTQITLTRYIDYEASLTHLRKVVHELASQAVDETVNAISATANEILKEIFEESISILLKTHKELKTGKDKTKLQINLQVMYRGQLYDSPYRLSGGEQDRLSLALTLAIAQIAGSPILLLDECMASISDKYQEICLTALDSRISTKCILHICHSAIKGQHTTTLNL